MPPLSAPERPENRDPAWQSAGVTCAIRARRKNHAFAGEWLVEVQGFEPWTRYRPWVTHYGLSLSGPQELSPAPSRAAPDDHRALAVLRRARASHVPQGPLPRSPERGRRASGAS